MREFPTKFIHSNLKLFQQYKFERDTCYLREAIYEHYIGELPEVKENDLNNYETPFDLQKFITTRDPPRIGDMLKIITQELEKLGWSVEIGPHNYALWIYPKGNKPKSIPEW